MGRYSVLEHLEEELEWNRKMRERVKKECEERHKNKQIELERKFIEALNIFFDENQ